VVAKVDGLNTTTPFHGVFDVDVDLTTATHDEIDGQVLLPRNQAELVNECNLSALNLNPVLGLPTPKLFPEFTVHWVAEKQLTIPKPDAGSVTKPEVFVHVAGLPKYSTLSVCNKHHPTLRHWRLYAEVIPDPLGRILLKPAPVHVDGLPTRTAIPFSGVMPAVTQYSCVTHDTMPPDLLPKSPKGEVKSPLSAFVDGWNVGPAEANTRCWAITVTPRLKKIIARIIRAVVGFTPRTMATPRQKPLLLRNVSKE
jgi:hypothetical protein